VPTKSLRLSATLLTGLFTSLVLPVSAAHAALSCAPDHYEKDTATTAAPLSVGTTTTRAICQGPTPQPRTSNPRDEDFFVFTASGTKAYTIQAVNVGTALANDAYDRGGLQLALTRLNADGTMTSVEQNRAMNGDRVITPVLPAGSYVVRAITNDMQVYQPSNTMDLKTVQGQEGSYGVQLTESAPAPVVTAVSLSSSSVKGGTTVTGTYTLSAPAPAGGMVVDVKSSHVYNAWPGPTFAPAGATQVSFKISTRASSASDLNVTLTAWARVGATKSVTLRVAR
jgi:hypothetical protein